MYDNVVTQDLEGKSFSVLGLTKMRNEIFPGYSSAICSGGDKGAVKLNKVRLLVRNGRTRKLDGGLFSGQSDNLPHCRLARQGNGDSFSNECNSK